MSSDNYTYVGRHGATYYVAMGFDSDERVPGIRRSITYSTATEAIYEAQKFDIAWNTQYGIRIGPEVITKAEEERKWKASGRR